MNRAVRVVKLHQAVSTYAPSWILLVVLVGCSGPSSAGTPSQPTTAVAGMMMPSLLPLAPLPNESLVWRVTPDIQSRISTSLLDTDCTANVVDEAPDVNAPVMKAAIRRLEERALASGRMHEPITIDVNKKSTVANITIPIDGKGTDAVSNASLRTLRDEVIPTTVGAVPDVEAGVTGFTAQWKDGTDEIKSKLPIVVGFVLIFAFALMLVAFRSPVIAAKAIVLNLLSVGAAYGVLVLVFQHAYGKDLLGFSSTAGIDPVVPLLLFVILFGLSMDYHVFLLSRIREAVQRGMNTDAAVAHGMLVPHRFLQTLVAVATPTS